jgi:spore germination cell wall hydrolase CwlJ-like protein
MYKLLLILLSTLVLIPTVKAQTTNTQVKCLADNIYYEAANQPIKGKIAVANVVMNRTKEPKRFGSTPCSVINQKLHGHPQFSWIEHRKRILYPDVYKECIKLAALVYTRNYPDVTFGSTFYKAVYVRNNWRYIKMVQIGGHSFYKG